ncbi:MAG TPA: hypothetical protein VK348_03770 [Planctomycetota bacterium]|nr:hypothetical protein [Planctomycetota bacterium]
MTRKPSRRDFLRQTATVAAALPFAGALRPLALAAPRLAPPPGLKTRHVIVLAFAGGVRSKEVIDTPANVPNLMRIAKNGVTMPNVRALANGHYGAALSIFTGNVEALGIRENEHGLNPTVFEYLHKDVGVAQSDLWLSTASGAQGRLFAHSDHPAYGKDHGANVLDGDGIFNVEFQKVLDSFGKPKADGDGERAVLDGLADALDPAAARLLQSGKQMDPAHLRAVEKFILDELTGQNARVTGPGAGDVKAIRVGANILRAFHPRLLGITLQNADVAHGSYNSYVEVIRRNDEELGKLWDLVQKDPELKDQTTILVLPEFGRDKDLNERNGLDHGDNSDCLRRIFLVAAGPDCPRDKVVKTMVDSHDVCPTVLSMFTKTANKHINGKIIKDLFA